MSWPAFNVERRSVNAIKPYERNSRTHTPEQILQISKSIQEWGWTQPILVDENDGVIAGHGRLIAAKSLGVEEVPVIVATGWSEAQKRAYTLADNQLAINAGWDTDLLKVEIGAITDFDFDIDLLGFSESELTVLTFDTAKGENSAEDEWNDMPEFSQEDQRPFRSFLLHFKDQKAIDEFAKLIDQRISEKTRYIWIPYQEPMKFVDKSYEDAAAVSDLHS